MFDFPGVFLLLLLVLVLGWLTRRAWRANRSVVKWTATTLAGLLTLALSIVLGTALFGYWKLNRTYPNPAPQLSVSVTPERVARGERFKHLCAGCHAADTVEAMTGRNFLSEEGAPPIGDFYAPNLTPVHLAAWSDGEIVRAIREGVHRSGRSLLIMPSSTWHNLSDEDVQAIVAYLRSLPAEGVETPPNRLNTLGAVMLLQMSLFEVQPPITEPVLSPPAGPTAAYGAYVASFTCEFCHGSDLLGDPDAQVPPLVGIPLAWSEQEFITFIRTGTRPDGSSVDGEIMPWEDLNWLLSEDDEVRAVYAHLQEVGAEQAK